jgi:Flp pilus assembly protein TadG
MFRVKTRGLDAGAPRQGPKRRAGVGTEGMAHMFWRPARAFRSLTRQMSRFVSAQDGGIEFVEFALVFPAFIAVVIAILEICYFLFAQQTLQTAAVEMGRQFMTNQAPTQASTVNANGQLQPGSSVCNVIQPLLSCGSVVVNIQPYQDWQSANTSMPSLYDNNCNVVTSWNFTPGTPGQIVVIQLIYPLTTVAGPLGFALSSVNCNGKMQVMGVTVIRVEPS